MHRSLQFFSLLRRGSPGVLAHFFIHTLTVLKGFQMINKKLKNNVIYGQPVEAAENATQSKARLRYTVPATSIKAREDWQCLSASLKKTS